MPTTSRHCANIMPDAGHAKLNNGCLYKDCLLKHLFNYLFAISVIIWMCAYNLIIIMSIYVFSSNKFTLSFKTLSYKFII